MTAEFEKQNELELEALFDALRDEPEEPSSDLLARVLADAYEAQDARAAKAMPEPVSSGPQPARRGRIRGLLDMIGGWPAVAGLVTATVAGVWIGYNPPAALDDLTLSVMESSYSYDASLGSMLPVYSELLAEG
ncbi:hypothetical protein [Aliiruegeria lutimaris]|uniref:Dihydroorotate dehydrogenase n=1 Tax=Aliiruegeria lutimaris TaxID=571298 RepID=A0A1G8X2E9_9RHOB|nr:hypothetical protein [Aliiruegeria lutimaris]SDJ84818.1 hypothetical protein SAMN04488026_102544 [Aliiruegeria lutimaris]